MQINPIISTNTSNTNFKSAFPVVHWVAEANGSYAPLAEMKLVEALQEKLITCLNEKLLTPKEIKELAKKKKQSGSNARNKEINDLKKIIDIPAQTLRAYLASCDINYRNCTNKTKVRSFYNRTHAKTNRYTPVSYIISGHDVEQFNERYGKTIGRNIREYGKDSPEANYAKWRYHHDGLNFVNNDARRIKNERGETQVLHTKFEIARNNEGEIVGYRYIDSKFLPEFGPESPFEKLKRK